MWLTPNLDDDDVDGKADAVDERINGTDDRLDLFELRLAVDRPFDATIGGPGANSYRVLSSVEEGVERWYVEAVTVRSATSAATVSLTVRGETEPALLISIDVRPFVLCNALDTPRTMFVVRNDATRSFVDALRAALTDAGPELHVFDGIRGGDRWAQDAAEYGYFLGDPMPVALKGMRARFAFYPCEELDELFAAYNTARNRALVVAGEPRPVRHFQDWYGNLECTPPFRAADGKVWPQGRVIVGRQRDVTMHDDVRQLLQAQGVQWPPIELDVSMTQIGHVDELVNFVPCATARHGFKMLVASPTAGRRWLEEQQRAGRGALRLLAGKRGATTIDALLADAATMAANEATAASMLANRTLLVRELDLPEADVVDVPIVYRRRGLGVWPNAVNGVTLGARYLSPRLFGPVADGVDLLEEDLRRSLGGTGVACVFLDCFDGYSVNDGQIHCGTNVLRTVRD